MKLIPFGLEEKPMSSTPGASFCIGTRLFLRALAVIHALAFASYWWQWRGLLGPNGLLPAGDFLRAVSDQLGGAAFLQVPSLCWIFGTDWFPPVLCGIAIAVSIILFLGYLPGFCLLVLWTAYLSLVSVGDIFYGFQWDSLLLEATLLALPLAPWSLRPDWKTFDPTRLARGLIWWLLARLMFLSGAVKLASGDTSWRDLSALSFHFETQPLPTSLAWYVHQLPSLVLTGMCVAMFTIELVAPTCLFGLRRLRHHAAWLLIALQVAIALIGNYTFFNVLTVALCLTCFDDVAWRKLLRTTSVAPPPVRRHANRAVRVFATAVVVVTGTAALASLGVRPAMGISQLFNVLAPFRSLNNYGLFAVMTHPRYELIVEGSDDERDWLEYEFPYKPGDLARAPAFVAPYQPRLDWHLWFAALDTRERNPWVDDLCVHLLRGTPEVLSLLGKNPFPQHPPRFVRIVRYEYHFTDWAERKRDGQSWKRTLVDIYLPSSTIN